MHSDRCKEFIHANSPGFSLANEFIESIDPEREERVWQRFQSPQDILPELSAWLGGDETSPLPTSPPPSIVLPPVIKPAKQIARPAGFAFVAAALQRTRVWLSDLGTIAELNAMSPTVAAEAALRKFDQELGGSGA